MNVLVTLIYNLSLLIALSSISGYIDKHYPRTALKGLIVQGVLFGIVAIAGMMLPLAYNEGLIFDGRSIIVSLSTLFFGPISGLIAAIMAIVFRLILGGTGLVPGILVVISSLIIGSIFHIRKKQMIKEITAAQFLYLGFAVHTVMLLMMFSLPFPTAVSIIQRIGIPVIICYSLATVLIGKILSDQEENFRITENNKINELKSRKDIVERRHAEESLQKSEDKYRKLVDNINEGIFISNENGIILFANNALAHIHGFESSDMLVNKNFIDFIEPSSRNDILNSFKSEIQSGKALNEIEMPVISADGSTIFVLITPSVIREGEQITGMSGIVRDITDRKKAEEEIRNMNANLEIRIEDRTRQLAEKNENLQTEMKKRRQLEERFRSALEDKVKERTKELEETNKELVTAKDKAEEMSSLKTHFLANMSHELRTPLIGITGFADFLRKDIEDPELKEMAEIIFNSGNRLSETLNLILDLSKFESEKMNFIYQQIELVNPTKEIINLFMESAHKKGLYLKSSFSQPSIFIKTDERAFRVILNNLINNAIKYTIEGGVVVEISIEENFVELKVIDTGIGIAVEKQTMIFEEFRQASEGYNRNFEGTGLGLNITKKLVEKFGGQISVDSELGKGTTFVVKLPVTDVENVKNLI